MGESHKEGQGHHLGCSATVGAFMILLRLSQGDKCARIMYCFRDGTYQGLKQFQATPTKQDLNLLRVLLKIWDKQPHPFNMRVHLGTYSN